MRHIEIDYRPWNTEAAVVVEIHISFQQFAFSVNTKKQQAIPSELEVQVSQEAALFVREQLGPSHYSLTKTVLEDLIVFVRERVNYLVHNHKIRYR